MIRVLIRAVLVVFLAVSGLQRPADAWDEFPFDEGEITYSNCYEGPEWELLQDSDLGVLCDDHPPEACSLFLRHHNWHYYWMYFVADNTNPPPLFLNCSITWRVHEGCCWGWED